MTTPGAQLRAAGSPTAHARALKARVIVPDEDGVWTVVFQPDFSVKAEDFGRMAEHIGSTPGITIANRATALAFTLDYTGEHNPDAALDRVQKLLHVARRDHIIVTQLLEPDGAKANVKLLFRLRKTQGALLDLASIVSRMDGVISAESTDDNEIILELNAHFATKHGVQLVAGRIANTTGAHVVRIDTEDPVMPLKGAREMLGNITANPPFMPAPAPGKPPFAMPPLPKSGRQARRTVLLCRRRAYRTTAV